MKSQLFTALCLALGFTASSQAFANNTCQTTPSNQPVLALFQAWNSALQTGNPEEVVKHYAHNAVLLPTVSNKPRHNHEEIKDYFQHFLAKKPYGTLVECNIRQFDRLAINSGIYRFELGEQPNRKEVLARFTYVYEKQGQDWKIIEHHSSVLPE